jgi:hypothetical protein
MTARDPFEIWRAERRSGVVPEGFSDRVMSAVRATQLRPGRRPAASDGRPAAAFSILTLAAGVLVVVACHAALVGGILLALTGTAR